MTAVLFILLVPPVVVIFLAAIEALLAPLIDRLVEWLEP